MVSSQEYALEIGGDFIKVMHTCAGLYIWEYVTTLDFEWEVYTGKRAWRWSFVVYVITRALALIAILVSLVGFNVTREFNCNIWFRTVLFAGWSAAAFSTFLLLLRSVAIWGRDLRIIAISGFFWTVNLVGTAYALTRAHAKWSPALKTCAITSTEEFKWSITINFIQDFVLLGIMLLGVLHKRNATHLWNMLYFQGLFWILTAILTELPNVVLPFRNINDAWNLMFQYPHLTLMVIASSRAYRDIFQYITSDQDSDPSRRGRKPPRMHVTPRNGDVQVTITKTIEFDVELHLERGAAKQLRGDEESVLESRELTKEEQHARSLERQLKHDLEI